MYTVEVLLQPTGCASEGWETWKLVIGPLSVVIDCNVPQSSARTAKRVKNLAAGSKAGKLQDAEIRGEAATVQKPL